MNIMRATEKQNIRLHKIIIPRFGISTQHRYIRNIYHKYLEKIYNNKNYKRAVQLVLLLRKMNNIKYGIFRRETRC